MKIIAENPAEEALLWRIKALSDELVNQDNRSTNMPMWTILDNNKAGKDYGAVMYFTGQVVEQKLDVALLAKLLAVTPSHLLNAMPQYKAKEKTALMYIYPVMMALDIAGYDRVIVGEDQRPHIEFARDILPRVGLKCPDPIYTKSKIMDLRHPDRKMSKSEPKSCLFLDDEDYERKIMKAVTDVKGLSNLRNIYIELGGQSDIENMSNYDLKRAIVELYKSLNNS